MSTPVYPLTPNGTWSQTMDAINDLNARINALEAAGHATEAAYCNHLAAYHGQPETSQGEALHAAAGRVTEYRPCPHCGAGVLWQTSGGLGAHPIQYHDCKQPATPVNTDQVPIPPGCFDALAKSANIQPAPGDDAANVGSNVGSRSQQTGDDAVMAIMKVMLAHMRHDQPRSTLDDSRAILAAVRAGSIPGVRCEWADVQSGGKP